MTADKRHTIFGRTFACECGRTHRVQPDEVIYADDALARLPGVCRVVAEEQSCAVLMDVRTREVAGAEAAQALAADGWQVTEVVVEDPAEEHDPVCDDTTKATLAPQAAGAALIVAVGSGVISDLGKWLAFEAGAGFVTFATAASMNGYASANVAPTIEAVKTLIRARPPAAVLSSPSVLAAAPYEMTAAGLGDVLVAEIEPTYLEHPADLKARKGAAIAALFDALLLTGVAMTLAETSAPASGGEHLISHSLDMMSSLDGRPHDLHGRQVGVGTVLAAELYRRVLAIESPELHDAPAGIDRAFWGSLADAVAAKYAEKAERLRAAKQKLARGSTWDSLRQELSDMLRSPQQIRGCLAAGGAACRAEDIGCDRDRLLQAFLHAHEIRPRFTVLDLARLLGLMPGAAGEIIERWT